MTMLLHDYYCYSAESTVTDVTTVDSADVHYIILLQLVMSRNNGSANTE